MCYKFTFPYRYPMLQHWKWPGSIGSQTRLSKIEPSYRATRKLSKRFKSWFTRFWSPQLGRNQWVSPKDLLSEQPNGMSMCHWQRAQLPSHYQEQVAKENKKHGHHRQLQMGNCRVQYSRLPISNPRVINRTEVEVPYLGDWLGPRFFPFVYQGYY